MDGIDDIFVTHVINTSLVISIVVVIRCLCEERPSLVSPRLTDAGERLSMNIGSQLPATALMSEFILISRLSVVTFFDDNFFSLMISQIRVRMGEWDFSSARYS